MVKKQKKQDFQIIEILERKEEPNKGYIYLVKYLNGEKNWILQKRIKFLKKKMKK